MFHRNYENVLSPELIIHGYHIGIFPMADSAHGKVRWYLPKMRAIIPLENFRVSRSLRQVINKNLFEIRFNRDFRTVIMNCAAPRKDSTETWISKDIIFAYYKLHELGYAHSVEAYQNDELVGGLYGVSIGGAFFGESMFYKVSNASKVALFALVSRLREREFKLLDSQFMNENVQRFGAIEVPHTDYMSRLNKAIDAPTSFF
jgi:leucyl/phenylalanyl-tRNA--protein transferase